MTVTVHPRAGLGLGPPNPGRLTLRTPSEIQTQHLGVTWHWVGAGGTLYRPNQIERLRAIWNEHVVVRGYGDIAYHGAFDADANVYQLRDGRYVGAHATSDNNEANRWTDGVCFLEDDRGLTEGALEAMAWWIGLERYLHGNVCTSYAHQWWAKAGHGGTATECPGTQLDALIGFLHGNA